MGSPRPTQGQDNEAEWEQLDSQATATFLSYDDSYLFLKDDQRSGEEHITSRGVAYEDEGPISGILQGSSAHSSHAQGQYSEENDPQHAYSVQRSPSSQSSKQLPTATSFLPVPWDVNPRNQLGGIPHQGPNTHILAGQDSPTHFTHRAEHAPPSPLSLAPRQSFQAPSISLPLQPRPVLSQHQPQHQSQHQPPPLSYDPPPPRDHSPQLHQEQPMSKQQRLLKQQQLLQLQQQQRRLAVSPPIQTAAKPSALWRTQPNQQPPTNIPGLPSPNSATNSSAPGLPSPRPYATQDIPVSPYSSNQQQHRSAGPAFLGSHDSGAGGASAWAAYVSGYGGPRAENVEDDFHRSPLTAAGGNGHPPSRAWPSRDQQHQRDQGRAGIRATAVHDEEAQVHLAVMERTSKSLQALLEEQGASLAAVQQRLAQSEDAEQGCRRRLTEVESQLRSRDGMLDSARHHVEGLTADLRRAQEDLGSSRGRSSESASELSMAQDMIRQIRKEGEIVTRKLATISEEERRVVAENAMLRKENQFLTSTLTKGRAEVNEIREQLRASSADLHKAASHAALVTTHAEMDRDNIAAQLVMLRSQCSELQSRNNTLSRDLESSRDGSRRALAQQQAQRTSISSRPAGMRSDHEQEMWSDVHHQAGHSTQAPPQSAQYNQDPPRPASRILDDSQEISYSSMDPETFRAHVRAEARAQMDRAVTSASGGGSSSGYSLRPASAQLPAPTTRMMDPPPARSHQHLPPSLGQQFALELHPPSASFDLVRASGVPSYGYVNPADGRSANQPSGLGYSVGPPPGPSNRSQAAHYDSSMGSGNTAAAVAATRPPGFYAAMMQDARQGGRLGPGGNSSGSSALYIGDGVIGNSDYAGANSVSAPNPTGATVRIPANRRPQQPLASGSPRLDYSSAPSQQAGQLSPPYAVQSAGEARARNATAALNGALPYGTEDTLKEMMVKSRAMEDGLVVLCSEKGTLEAEFAKLPVHGRSQKERSRKVEVEQRLEGLNKEISNLRLTLKRLHGK